MESKSTTDDFVTYFKAADGLSVAAAEFVHDFQKGDFDLPKLAQCDLESMRDALLKYESARKAIGMPNE